MKINTSSWHYKLVTELNGYAENNLCGYMRQIAGALIGIVIIAFFAIMVTWATLVPIWQALFQQGVREAVFIAYLFWYVFVGEVFIKYSKSQLRHDGKWYNEPLWHTTKERKPSLIAAYINAKKQKICPTIEFVSGDDI